MQNDIQMKEEIRQELEQKLFRLSFDHRESSQQLRIINQANEQLSHEFSLAKQDLEAKSLTNTNLTLDKKQLVTSGTELTVNLDLCKRENQHLLETMDHLKGNHEAVEKQLFEQLQKADELDLAKSRLDNQIQIIKANNAGLQGRYFVLFL